MSWLPGGFLFHAGTGPSPREVSLRRRTQPVAAGPAVHRPSNVLVLDEPTNDLDIETLELLEELLASNIRARSCGEPRPRISQQRGHPHAGPGRRGAGARNTLAATTIGCGSGRSRTSRQSRRRKSRNRRRTSPRKKSRSSPIKRHGSWRSCRCRSRPWSRRRSACWKPSILPHSTPAETPMK